MMDEGEGGGHCGLECLKTRRQAEKDKRDAKNRKLNTLKGAHGFGNGSGGGGTPPFTSTPQPPVVAVPVQVPDGSPSIPIITTVTTTQTAGVVVSTGKSEPIKFSNGWTMDPKYPGGFLKIIGGLIEGFNSLGLSDPDGNSVEFQNPHMIPREVKMEKTITYISRTTTTIDQYGSTTVDTVKFQVEHNNHIEESIDGGWRQSYPNYKCFDPSLYCPYP